MLISEKMARLISFFHQKMRNRWSGNYQKRTEKSLHVLTGDAKNEILGPSGPPLMHLSVNNE